MATITEALQTLRAAAGDGRLGSLAVDQGLDLVGVFGSGAAALRGDASALVDGSSDLDVVVSATGRDLDVLGVIGALTDLVGHDRLDLLVAERADPVARAEALSGVGLYESTPGRWAEAQVAAVAERWDTAWLRRLDLDALAS